MINKSLSDELISYFERCLSFYESFLELEANKYNDILNNILSSIDQHVKDEQVYMMKAKGLEAERTKLVGQTEKPNATFKELIPLLDESVREQAKQHFESLSAILLEMKEVNKCCNQLTEIKLRQVQNYLDSLEKQNDQPETYNKQAQKSKEPISMVSKKV
ncbi:MAG: flagellar protein FlgN [Clostridia bacterium]|nr:flagellar protein FlgN [Clostridia bacterium]